MGLVSGQGYSGSFYLGHRKKEEEEGEEEDEDEEGITSDSWYMEVSCIIIIIKKWGRAKQFGRTGGRVARGFLDYYSIAAQPFGLKCTLMRHHDLYYFASLNV